MGKRLRDFWHQIRGDAKWWLVTTIGGWVATSLTTIMTTLVTWWGWVIGLSGPHLVVLALSIVALCVVIANGVRQWWVFRLEAREAPPRPPSSPPTVPKAPHEPLRTFPRLTTEHIANLKEAIHSRALRIKLVSIPEYMFFAEDLERALRIAECRFVFDPETNKTIFLARSLHPNNQVVLRYRKSDTDFVLNMIYFTLTQTLDSILASQLTFRFLTSATRVEFFPPESSVDHFQIEIGGAP